VQKKIDIIRSTRIWMVWYILQPTTWGFTRKI